MRGPWLSVGVLLAVCLALLMPVRSELSGPSARAAPQRPAADPFARLLTRSHRLGPLASAREVRFLVTLTDTESRVHRARLTGIGDPASQNFGRYLSPRRYAHSAGPSPRAVARIRRFLGRRGIHAVWQRGDGWMEIRGPAGALQRVFGVRIERYRSLSGIRFFASRRDPAVPGALRGLITSAGHISSYQDVRLQRIRPGGLHPADLLAAYDIQPLRSHGSSGAGQTIAFIEIDGYNQSDLDQFAQRFNLPPLRPEIANGVRLSNVEGETELDLEVAHEIAPRARLRLYNCPNGCSASDLVTIESRAVRENPRGIVSVSIGACEPAAGRGDAEAESAAFGPTQALGVSVFVASGDNGAFTCLDQDWGAPPGQHAMGVSIPGSVPGVTSVGGTRLSLNRNAGWYREEVWENPAETSGSGGGRSVYFARPSWQHGPGTGGGQRQVPDVAADADPLTSAQVVIQGNLAQAGGTSQAAPIWAGMTALINQYLKRHGRPVAGFMNPSLYRLAAAGPPYPPFHDVTLGTNLIYAAGPGYDMATGLGTPDAWNLARDLLAQGNGG